MKPPLLIPSTAPGVVLSCLQKLLALPGPGGKRLVMALRAVLAFLLLALVYEARRQQGRLGHWAVAASKRMALVVRWRLREWGGYWPRLFRFRRKHAAFLDGE
jgi:hypothetical protein